MLQPAKPVRRVLCRKGRHRFCQGMAKDRPPTASQHFQLASMCSPEYPPRWAHATSAVRSGSRQPGDACARSTSYRIPMQRAWARIHNGSTQFVSRPWNCGEKAADPTTSVSVDAWEEVALPSGPGVATLTCMSLKAGRNNHKRGSIDGPNS